jgi:hypothetical protein
VKRVLITLFATVVLAPGWKFSPALAQTLSENRSVPVEVLSLGSQGADVKVTCHPTVGVATSETVHADPGERKITGMAIFQETPGAVGAVCDIVASTLSGHRPCGNQITINRSVGAISESFEAKTGTDSVTDLGFPASESFAIYVSVYPILPSGTGCPIATPPVFDPNRRAGSLRIRPDRQTVDTGVGWKASRECRELGASEVTASAIATGPLGGLGIVSGWSDATNQECRFVLEADRDFPGKVRLSLNGLAQPSLITNRRTTFSEWSQIAAVAHVNATFNIIAGLTDPAPLLEPVLTQRLLDTRTGAPGRIGQSGPRTLNIREQVGQDVAAVLLTVTVIDPIEPTWVSVTPSPLLAIPQTSNVNVNSHSTRANTALVPLGLDGSVVIYNAFGTTHAAIDLIGVVRSTSSLRITNPRRILDTRTANSALGEGVWRRVPIRQLAGLPIDTKWVMVNLTATNTTTNSFLSITTQPGDASTSRLNWSAHYDAATFSILELNQQGDIYTYVDRGTTDLIIDVAGSALPTVDLLPIPLVRALDTRSRTWLGTDATFHSGRVPPGQAALFAPSIFGVRSEGVASVIAVVTSTDTTTPGYLSSYPFGSSQGQGSLLNTSLLTAVPNMTLLNVLPRSGLSNEGSVWIHSGDGTTHILVDMFAYLTK